VIKKTIILHIGAPKTGTTSIQTFLSDYSDLLKSDGVLVPKSTRYSKKNHTLLVNYCINNRMVSKMNIRNGISDKRQLKDFKISFYNNLRNEIMSFKGKTVVMSSEQLYGSLSTLKELTRLKKLFKDLYDELKIVIYVREQSSMLCSLYSTRIKGGDTALMPGLEEFSKTEIFDYNNRLKNWETVFGKENILLRVFDIQHLVKNDVVQDFSQTVNLPEYSTTKNYLNTTLNAKQCEFLRLVNHHIPPFTNMKVNIVRNGLRKMVARTEIDSPPISDLISKEYQNIYEQSNENLAKRYFENPAKLFTKRTLNNSAIKQIELLTEEDKKSIAYQIINDSTGKKSEDLCKCIAAIFNVAYDGQKVSPEFLESLNMNPYRNYHIDNMIEIISGFIKQK
jgi:hypothetical protein